MVGIQSCAPQIYSKSRRWFVKKGYIRVEWGIMYTTIYDTKKKGTRNEGSIENVRYMRILPSSRTACSRIAFALTNRSISAFRAQHQASRSSLLLARRTRMLYFPSSGGTLTPVTSPTVYDFVVFAVSTAEIVVVSFVMATVVCPPWCC